MTFKVYREDGSEVTIGDTITSSLGEDTIFRGCTHPRKIETDEIGCTRYPSVYNVEIRHDADGYVWNPVSAEGRRMWETREW